MQTTQGYFYHPHCFRQILGVRFFIGTASEAVQIGVRGGLVVVPAAPALMELVRDGEYRRALMEADLAITDSSFMVIIWNALKLDRVRRVSGLEYLKLLIARPEFQDPGTTLWIMPTEESMERNLAWLKSQGFPVTRGDCYVAPKYPRGAIRDEVLLEMVKQRNPRHVIVGIGGGVQEKLGLYLKQNCSLRTAIHCIGAAIGFLSGDQVRIPRWADQWFLGWMFRCASNPMRFVPRYVRALRLLPVLLRYHDRMPELSIEHSNDRILELSIGNSSIRN